MRIRNFKELVCALCVMLAAAYGYRTKDVKNNDNGNEFRLVSNNGSDNGDETVSGKVVKVIDGDTYDLLTGDNKTVRVRMNGIDAPEAGMPYAKQATEYLKELTRNQTIRISLKDKDRYGRFTSFSYLDDERELSCEMIKAGYAWHYKQYNNDKELGKMEQEAREARRGLWADNKPMAPWEVRRLKRQGQSTKEILRNNGN